MSVSAAFGALLRRDIALAFSQGGGGAVGLGFFAAAVALAPLAIGADPNLLAPLAPGFFWVIAALAALLNLERLYQADFEDGSLEPLILSPLGVELFTLAKTTAFWLTSIAPLAALAPVLGVLLHLPAEAYIALVASLLLGGPALASIGGAAAALTVGVRRGGLLIAVIALPLFTPVLIFGAGATLAALEQGRLITPSLLFLTAYSLFATALAPIAAGAALRLNLE